MKRVWFLDRRETARTCSDRFERISPAPWWFETFSTKWFPIPVKSGQVALPSTALENISHRRDQAHQDMSMVPEKPLTFQMTQTPLSKAYPGVENYN